MVKMLVDDKNQATAVIDYAPWFYVRDGAADDDKFVVEIGDGSSSWTTIQTIAADDVCPTGERCWNNPLVSNDAYAKVRWIRQRVRITSNLTTGRYLRFHAIRGDSSPAECVMEACIDEVRVWATY